MSHDDHSYVVLQYKVKSLGPYENGSALFFSASISFADLTLAIFKKWIDMLGFI